VASDQHIFSIRDLTHLLADKGAAKAEAVINVA
jgi:hypothetical protein